MLDSENASRKIKENSLFSKNNLQYKISEGLLGEKKKHKPQNALILIHETT